MTTAKHTPGPWGISSNLQGDGVQVNGQNGTWTHSRRSITVLHADGTETCIADLSADIGAPLENFCTAQDVDEMLANAALIAAAPELLAELESLVDLFGKLLPFCGCLRAEVDIKARDAKRLIAQARGES